MECRSASCGRFSCWQERPQMEPPSGSRTRLSGLSTKEMLSFGPCVSIVGEGFRNADLQDQAMPSNRGRADERRYELEIPESPCKCPSSRKAEHRSKVRPRPESTSDT